MNKLSGILEVALKDLQDCENDREVLINMNRWCSIRDGICYVCLGGAVIRNTLKFVGVRELVKEWVPSKIINREISNRLEALDALRDGFVSLAAECLGVKTQVRTRRIINYHVDRPLWHQQMNKLLQDLKNAGE